MSWHSIDSLDDARAATTGLLRPFSLGTWARLALVAVFVGGTASNASVNFNLGGTTTPGLPQFGPLGPFDLPFDGLPPFDPGVVTGQRVLLGVAALVGVLFLFALAFSLVAAVMQFVFVTGLADREVRIRGPFRTHLGNGLRLFGFQFAVVALTLLVVGGPLALTVFGGATVNPGLLVVLLPVVLVGVALALVVALLFQLTTDFVVPTMLAADVGVLDGWRRFFPTLRTEWEEFALYVIIRFSLGILVGALVAAATLFVAVLVALPFVILGGAVLLAFSAPGALPLVAWALLAVVGLCYALTVAVAGAFLLVPVVTFFRYYSLYVLGRLDDGLDLVGASPQETTGDSPGGSVAA
ncbi:DUF7544 domain-containing protein [Halogeometricum limi]|uniref:Membrane domain of glycerophosphoryl diester phosphodiesterase n=1 Tax=Halogeometricum limi TaxID=555875 RepID=A0A1I6GS16_9EURY|nr:hypothetical protein [Halogeometricum limi]SFR44909.1 hypothetical protein SAMN04488124_1451 [Halogeometricum limi]